MHNSARTVQSNECADADADGKGGGLALLAALSLLGGAAAGLVGAAFRLALVQADQWRNALVDGAHGGQPIGLLIVVAICSGAAALAAWLVRRFSPYASGSGIPHVEAVLEHELPPAPPQLIPVKFFGGLLAIGGGLALGREGPTVQMGASVAHLIGRVFGRSAAECEMLLAAGAGAGLATAFSAPIAGAIFVLEELVGRFDTRIMLATCVASVAAIGVARVFLGDAPDFTVQPLPLPEFGLLPVYLLFGAIAGLLGAAYNRTILAALAVGERRFRGPVELRAALVGAAVGILAWCLPQWVGGGDAITQRTLLGGASLALLPLLFLFRFVLGAVSYAAGTPGGLFAPMLVLGAQIGLFFGLLYSRWFPGPAELPMAFAVTGMAAFFAAVVRAPLTGIVLVLELTASYTQILPMLAASAAAMLVPTLVGNRPIYESLRPAARPQAESVQ